MPSITEKDSASIVAAVKSHPGLVVSGLGEKVLESACQTDRSKAHCLTHSYIQHAWLELIATSVRVGCRQQTPNRNLPPLELSQLSDMSSALLEPGRHTDNQSKPLPINASTIHSAGQVAKRAVPLLKPPGFKSSGRVCQTEPKYYRRSPHGSRARNPPARLREPGDDTAIDRKNITMSDEPLWVAFNINIVSFMVVRAVMDEYYTFAHSISSATWPTGTRGSVGEIAPCGSPAMAW